MIAEVIPYTRTIRGKDNFDYAIPDGMTVAVGDIVDVTFRGKKVYGLVRGLKETSDAKRLQAIIGVRTFDAWRDPQRVKFVEWFADYYFLSMPTAWYAMQFPLLQRPRVTTNETEVVASSDAPATVLDAYTTQIIRGASHVIRYDQRSDCIQLYTELIARETGHVLIVVPEFMDVETLAHALGSLRPTITLTSKTSPSEWNVAVQRLQQAEPVLCIGTKRTIFLPWSLCTMVIVDQEEARAHKQFDGNPRYHVRAVAEWLAVNAVTDVHARPTVIYTSHAPSIDRMAHAQQDGDVILHIPRPLPLDHVRVVDMEHERQNKNYSWFSDTVVEAIQSSTKSFVFFNRVGRYGSAVCVDCGTLLPLEVDVCTQCHSQRIRFTRKGTQELERELRQRFPKKRILRIDRDQDAAAMTREQIDRAELIIGTEKVLHMLPLSYFECICVLSVDHLLVYPHFRSHERVYQLLSELCSIPVPTYVQTSAPQHSVIRNATQNAYDPFFTEELSVRKLLRLPPFGERFLLKNIKSGATKTVSGPLSPAQISTDTVVDRQ